MNALDVMAKAMAEYWDRPEQAECYEVQAEDVLTALSAAGFTIMSKEAVEAVRDELLEEGCQSVGDPIKWHRALKSSKLRKHSDLAHFIAGAAQAAIRSLKSKEGKVDS